jgi:hypothetical protein
VAASERGGEARKEPKAGDATTHLARVLAAHGQRRAVQRRGVAGSDMRLDERNLEKGREDMGLGGTPTQQHTHQSRKTFSLPCLELIQPRKTS